MGFEIKVEEMKRNPSSFSSQKLNKNFRKDRHNWIYHIWRDVTEFSSSKKSRTAEKCPYPL
jgi:hypothetical protein